MERSIFTFKLVEINKIREMLSGEIDESTINQMIMILKSNFHDHEFISLTDLRELLCEDLSQKQLSSVMQVFKTYQL